MQFLTRGLSQAVLRAPKAVETAVGTVVVTQRERLGQQSFSTLPPKNPYRGDDFTFDTPPGDNNFNPVKLAYRALEFRGEEKDKATKSPLIVHHSLYGRKENWNPISDLINRTTLRKVINVDARNHGESPHTKEMSLPLMTKDIFHLMKQCNFKDRFSDGRQYSFMGHHMGGRIGMLLALTQPYKIDKLIIVDTSVLVNEHCQQTWKNLRRACLTLLELGSTIREAQGYERLNIASKAIEDIVTDKKVRAHFLSSIILTDKPDAVWRINMVSYMSNPNMMLASPTLDNAVFKGEALFINGDRSQYVSRDHEKAILKVFPNAAFAWVKDADHLLHIEKPNEFNETIISFLES